MENFFFDNWFGLLRTLIVGFLAYVSLIVFLRLSGKRTLSKMNAFDFIVTVSLGSILATILLSKQVSLTSGALALALLIGLQYLITWTSIRIPWVRQAVTGEPTMLLYRGKFLTAALYKERVTEDEIRAAVRSAGLSSLEKAEAVILETDGSISVVQRAEGSNNSSLSSVKNSEGN
jgi:uncharacterized membrane protein YcaP (DUF421 family)